jgi:hypothetical protein
MDRPPIVTLALLITLSGLKGFEAMRLGALVRVSSVFFGQGSRLSCGKRRARTQAGKGKETRPGQESAHDFLEAL